MFIAMKLGPQKKVGKNLLKLAMLNCLMLASLPLSQLPQDNILTLEQKIPFLSFNNNKPITV